MKMCLVNYLKIPMKKVIRVEIILILLEIRRNNTSYLSFGKNFGTQILIHLEDACVVLRGADRRAAP